MEARAHAVSAKVYTALIFVKDGNGYKSFRMGNSSMTPNRMMTQAPTNGAAGLPARRSCSCPKTP